VRPFFRFISWTLIVFTFVSVALWLIGRVINDSVFVVQYVSWVPSVIYITFGVLCIAFSWLFALMAQPHLPASFAPDEESPREMMRFPRVGQRTRLIAGCTLLVASLSSFVFEYHMHRALRRAQGGASIRIAFWNAATDFIDDYADRFVSTQATLFALANPAAYCEWEKLRTAAGPNSDARRFGRLAVVSPWKITKWGGTSLDITGAKERRFGEQSFFDRGVAMFAELDAVEQFGRPIVVWVIDLPSDIEIPRKRMLSEARAALDTFTGPTLTTGKNGLDERIDAPPGFPEPDIIMGDFNTPRGSRSLQLLAGDLDHIYDRAGHGLMFTWDRERPMIAIDHIFVNQSIRVESYESRDMGRGRHFAQIADLSRAE
jgi:hypothetical protein